jgi:simple sugar transport system substrate-binding protein
MRSSEERSYSPSPQTTRRGLLKDGARGLVAVSTLGTLLSACGSSTSSSGSGTGTGGTATGFRPDIAVRFDPSLPAGSRPDLPGRFGYVAFSSDPFWVTFSKAVGEGCEAADLEMIEANAQGDASKYVSLVQQQMTQGVASTFVFALAPDALRPLLEDAIDSGVQVVTYSVAPSTIQVGADENYFGRRIGAAAAAHIVRNLGGEAQVLLFNEDKAPQLKPRYQGIRDALAEGAPNARIVKDLTPTNTADDGFRQASSAFAADPDINVVIGPGLATVGAFSALESKNADRPEMYIASIGGTEEELEKIKQPNSAYKTTWAYPDLLVGYMSARWTRNWLDGEVVPMGIYNPPLEITADNLTKFQEDMRRPERVFEEDRLSDYLELWGSISYDTRDSALREVWNGPQR